MLRNIIAFEWRYHVGRLSFWAASLFLLLFGFMSTARSRPDLEVHLNSPYALSFAVGLMSLASVLVLTLFSAQSVLRDHEFQMAEIVYTTAITKGRYLLGSYAGMLLAAVTAFSFALFGMVLGTILPRHDPSLLGRFDGLDFLWPFLVLLLPNMLFVGALLFAVGALSRSTLATYVSGILLYMLYIVTAIFTNSPLIATSSPPTPDGMAMAALADPFGLAAFFEQTHYWTAPERNTQRLLLAGSLLLNRIVWLAVAGAVLAALHRLFSFRLVDGKAASSAHENEELEPSTTKYRPAAISRDRRLTNWQALLSSLRLESMLILRSWPFWVMMIAWVGLNATEIGQFLHYGEYGTQSMATTALIIGRLREPLMLIGTVVLVYYSAELVWRDRMVGIDQIADASAVSSAVPMLSKTILLGGLIALMITSATIVCTVFQLILDGPPPNLAIYGSMFYFLGLPRVWVGVLAIFLQAISPNRYVGMLLALVALLFLHLGAFGGPQHPLLRYAWAPHVPFSEFSGFAPTAPLFHGLMLYAGLLACLLAAAAYGLWPRGTDSRWRSRLRTLSQRWRRPLASVTLGVALLWLATGASIFYDTNIVNGYQTAEQQQTWRADYETTYRHLENVPQPSLAHMEVEVALYPEQRRFRIAGTYRLINRSEQAIRVVWFSAATDARLSDLTLDGKPPSRVDPRLHTYEFTLTSPLQPGATADLSYTVEFDRRPLNAQETASDIARNGSFVLSESHLPRLGYRVGRELTDPLQRRRHGLPPNDRPDTVEQASALGLMEERAEALTYELVLSTRADQTAVAPGRLAATWQIAGRRYNKFVMDRPVMPLLAYTSARYASQTVQHGDVQVEVYFHPGHETNISRFLEAAKTSLDTFQQHFGPYPHDHLRIVEVVGNGKFTGMAASGTTYFTETGGFLTDLSDPERVDVVSKRVAHEVAHQWWGHQVNPANGPGATALVEATARYSELILLQQMHGPQMVTAALSFELDRYLTGRATSPEVPLYQVQRESFLFYAKGALVMMALHDLLGEDAVNQALRALVEQADAAPNTLDLLRELRQVAAPQHHELIDQWWTEVVLYDLNISEAQVETLEDGRYRVRFTAQAAKHALRDGEEVDLPMDEELEIAIYDQHPQITRSRQGLLHSQRVRFTGSQDIELVVDSLPRYVSIDPFLRRIERNRIDNVAKIIEVTAVGEAERP